MGNVTSIRTTKLQKNDRAETEIEKLLSHARFK